MRTVGGTQVLAPVPDHVEREKPGRLGGGRQQRCAVDHPQLSAGAVQLEFGQPILASWRATASGQQRRFDEPGRSPVEHFRSVGAVWGGHQERPTALVPLSAGRSNHPFLDCPIGRLPPTMSQGQALFVFT